MINFKKIIFCCSTFLWIGCEYQEEIIEDQINSKQIVFRDTILATDVQGEYRASFSNDSDLIDLLFFDLNGEKSYVKKSDTCEILPKYESKFFSDLNRHHTLFLKKVKGDFVLNEKKGRFNIITSEKTDIIEFDVFIISDKYIFKSRDNKKVIDTLLLVRKSLIVDDI